MELGHSDKVKDTSLICSSNLWRDIRRNRTRTRHGPLLAEAEMVENPQSEHTMSEDVEITDSPDGLLTPGTNSEHHHQLSHQLSIALSGALQSGILTMPATQRVKSSTIRSQNCLDRTVIKPQVKKDMWKTSSRSQKVLTFWQFQLLEESIIILLYMFCSHFHIFNIMPMIETMLKPRAMLLNSLVVTCQSRAGRFCILVFLICLTV